MVFDDSGARADWGWRNEYDLDGLVRVMFQYLAPKFGKNLPQPNQRYGPDDDENGRWFDDPSNMALNN